MAKAILEYDLNDVDDRMSHFRAVKSLDMASALFEISYNFRKHLEYSLEAKEIKGEEVTPYEVINMVMDKLVEIIQEDNDLNIDELIH